MLTSQAKVQCRGCGKWFKPRGLSQHISKTRDTRCRNSPTQAVSRVPRTSSSIQHAAMQSPLGRNHALPASTGGSPDWEYDHTRRGQLSDAEIAVTQDDTSESGTDPADVADADAYEELMRYSSTTTNPNQMTVGEAPELTEQEGQTGVEGDHADLAPPQGSSVSESRQSTSMSLPWAPFRSELDWKVARWSKMHERTSTEVREFLAIPGLVDALGLSFRTVKELDEKIDSLIF